MQRFEQQEQERHRKILDQQKFREMERKKYYLEEEVYKRSLEYRIQQTKGAAHVQVVKEDGIPLMVNRAQRNY